MKLFSHDSPLKGLGAGFIGASLLGVAVLPGAALACDGSGDSLSIRAVFIEGAPIDRLVVTNQSAAGWRIEQLTWDLTPSAGRVIFDTTAAGAGVQVFQPFRQLDAQDTRRAGGQLTDDSQLAVIVAEPAVTDGDQSLVVQFESFGPEQVFGMSIDVDDQIDSRETIVDRSEMQGATLRASFAHQEQERRTLTASFDDSARASSCEPVNRAGE